MASFETWTQENLIKFARDAQLKILQQDQEIQHLKQDLKDAMNACRELMRRVECPTDQ